MKRLAVVLVAVSFGSLFAAESEALAPFFLLRGKPVIDLYRPIPGAVDAWKETEVERTTLTELIKKASPAVKSYVCMALAGHGFYAQTGTHVQELIDKGADMSAATRPVRDIIAKGSLSPVNAEFTVMQAAALYAAVANPEILMPIDSLNIMMCIAASENGSPLRSAEDVVKTYASDDSPVAQLLAVYREGTVSRGQSLETEKWGPIQLNPKAVY